MAYRNYRIENIRKSFSVCAEYDAYDKTQRKLHATIKLGILFVPALWPLFSRLIFAQHQNIHLNFDQKKKKEPFIHHHRSSSSSSSSSYRAHECEMQRNEMSSVEGRVEEREDVCSGKLHDPLSELIQTDSPTRREQHSSNGRIKNETKKQRVKNERKQSSLDVFI